MPLLGVFAAAYLGIGPAPVQIALVPSQPHVQEILIEALVPHAPKDTAAHFSLRGPVLQTGPLQHAQGSLFIGHVTPRQSGHYVLTLSFQAAGFSKTAQRSVTVLPGHAQSQTSPWLTRGAILAFFGALWWLSSRRRQRS